MNKRILGVSRNTKSSYTFQAQLLRHLYNLRMKGAYSLRWEDPVSPKTIRGLSTDEMSNSDAPLMDFQQHPPNVPLKGKFANWKHYRDGIILNHSVEGVNHPCFHYIDSRKKDAFRECSPGFEVKYD